MCSVASHGGGWTPVPDTTYKGPYILCSKPRTSFPGLTLVDLESVSGLNNNHFSSAAMPNHTNLSSTTLFVLG